MKVRLVDAPHPSTLTDEALVAECDLRTQRRSGPGGQHRNKTSSGAFLTHRPTAIVAEATERRSQAQNRDVALQRLRLLLAVEIRTPSPLDDANDASEHEQTTRDRFHGHSMRFNDNNPDKAAVLALVLNDLWVAGGQPSLAAPAWRVSTSKIVALIRSYPSALALVNQIRSHHGRLDLH